jgi:uncharacterized SAM-binding protein YcdF (DUF218 family)
MLSRVRSLWRWLRWLLAGAVMAAFCLLRWGGNLLIASDSLPARADAAIVLQGSIVGQRVRLAGAMDLLRRGAADRVLLSVPKESYWGQSIPPLARAYIERNYGNDLAARVDFCETSEEVNSTMQEAQALLPCIREYHWQSIVLVTSNYHTRRAGILWRRAMKDDPAMQQLFVDGVADPEFQQPWWRHRQAAKTFVLETVKLTSSMLGG